MNSDSSIAAAPVDVLGGRLGGAAVAGQLAIALEPARQRVAQPGLVGPAFGRRDGVAIGVAEPGLLVLGPGHRPFDPAAIGEIGLADKRPRRQHRLAVEAGREKIAEPAGEMQPRLGRHAIRARQRRIAAPADFDAAEQIGL